MREIKKLKKRTVKMNGFCQFCDKDNAKRKSQVSLVSEPAVKYAIILITGFINGLTQQHIQNTERFFLNLLFLNFIKENKSNNGSVIKGAIATSEAYFVSTKPETNEREFTEKFSGIPFDKIRKSK